MSKKYVDIENEDDHEDQQNVNVSHNTSPHTLHAIELEEPQLIQAQQKPSIIPNKLRKYVILVSIVFITAIIITIAVVASQNNNSATGSLVPDTVPWSQLRLPLSVAPSSYKMTIYPNLDTFMFYGDQQIALQISQATSAIWLHALEMKITYINLLNTNSQQVIDVDSSFFYDANEFFVIKLKNEAISGNYILSLQYEAVLSNQTLAGLYRSAYRTNDGTIKHIAVTQFEPTDARRAFPCFDEPAFKAIFNITLVKKPQDVALSNMGIQTIVSGMGMYAGLDLVQFYPTLPMSTYLVAMIVCDFANITKTTPSGIKVSVWTPSGEIEQARLALDAGVSIVEYYQSFFGVSYPLPKLDMAAIPDFAAGAMENWGLITYRQIDLLYDVNSSSTFNKQNAADVVAHELAHQWFGNLVTMQWWSDLWLNEGFAAFTEIIGTAHFGEDWGMWDQFITDTQHNALMLDSLSSSHPIHVEVNDPVEINEIFDTISYDKGSSVLHMLRSTLGNDVYVNGLKTYLNRFRFHNSVSAFLWDALQESATNAGKNLGGSVTVADMMNTWTTQLGYPVIIINFDSNNNKLQLRQAHFTLQGQPKNDLSWIVPITYQKANDASSSSLLFKPNDNIAVDWNNNQGFIKFNVNRQGYYRVLYPMQLWNQIKNTLIGSATASSNSFLTISDRAGIIDDSFNFARVQLLTYSQVLDMLSYMTQEREYSVWVTALNHLSFLSKRLITEPIYGVFSQYVRQLLTPILAQTSFTLAPNTSHVTKLRRSLILAAATRYNVQSVRRTAYSLFQTWMNSNAITNTTIDFGAIDPDILETVFAVGIIDGSHTEWDYLWQQYMKPESITSVSEKMMILRCLALTREPWLINRFLAYTLDDSKIRRQDASIVISHISNNILASPFMWSFVQANWDAFHAGGFGTARIISTAVNYVHSAEQLASFETFFKTGSRVGGWSRTVDQVIETIQSQLNWQQQFQPQVQNWLLSNVSL